MLGRGHLSDTPPFHVLLRFGRDEAAIATLMVGEAGLVITASHVFAWRGQGSVMMPIDHIGWVQLDAHARDGTYLTLAARDPDTQPFVLSMGPRFVETARLFVAEVVKLRGANPGNAPVSTEEEMPPALRTRFL